MECGHAPKACGNGSEFDSGCVVGSLGVGGSSNTNNCSGGCGGSGGSAGGGGDGGSSGDGVGGAIRWLGLLP